MSSLTICGFQGTLAGVLVGLASLNCSELKLKRLNVKHGSVKNQPCHKCNKVPTLQIEVLKSIIKLKLLISKCEMIKIQNFLSSLVNQKIM